MDTQSSVVHLIGGERGKCPSPWALLENWETGAYHGKNKRNEKEKENEGKKKEKERM